MSLATLQRPIVPDSTWPHPSVTAAKRNSNPVEDAAHQQLCSSGYRPLCCVTCYVNGTTVELSGTLPSFFMKQMAQEVIRHVVGIHRIENGIEVVYGKEPLG
ncbi:BON domain-containing protein [Roseimaritima ulvae]|uniref:BON domain protein n=1 Tax=Roseimaritima ulvae TaxID=980254 RepID=A0A5B9QXX5_9BACT|nr:BON domain-containing protein [Roseimaritima ulvae]QEG38811.1 BON domain protein [Roseimaritima ulvae]